MKKGQSYTYTKIKEFAEDNDYSLEELGVDEIGKNFIVLSHNEKDKTISFVCTSASGNGYIYECVYSD